MAQLGAFESELLALAAFFLSFFYKKKIMPLAVRTPVTIKTILGYILNNVLLYSSFHNHVREILVL